MTNGAPEHKNGAEHHDDALQELRRQAQELARRIEALAGPAEATVNAAPPHADVVPLSPQPAEDLAEEGATADGDAMSLDQTVADGSAAEADGEPEPPADEFAPQPEHPAASPRLDDMAGADATSPDEAGTDGSVAEEDGELEPPEHEHRRPGVRREDLPRPIPKPSRVKRVVWSLIVLLLIAAAFVGGLLWAEYGPTQSDASVDDGAVATEAAAATDETAPADEAAPTDVAPAATARTEATTSATPLDGEPAGAAEAALAPDAATEDAATEDAPATTVAADPATVLAAADAALTAAGHENLEVAYEDGTLAIAGVVPSSAMGDGYFAYVNAVAAAVTEIPGVEAVAPRLFLRGDETALRAELRQLVAEQPIEFEFASADLTPDSQTTLARAAEIIQRHPGLRVLVAGHTDSSGSSETSAA